MNQIVKFGTDAVGTLENFLGEKKPKNIFLVTGKKSYSKNGAKNKLEPILEKYNYVRFFDFEENPKIEDVEKGVNLFNDNECDFIIAVGGGSTIDMAKLVNFFNKKNQPFVDNLKKGLSANNKCPLVVMPTTAGAGSEATHFAVVYINKLKHSVSDNNLLPDLVLIDHSFLASQTKYQMTVSGLDAFCQGIESFWSVNSTKESLEFSKKGMSEIWNNLKKAINGEEVLVSIAKGAYFSGKAINITKTTGPHALSYGFTTNYGIPHGHAVALFLPFFINFHKNINKESNNDSRGNLFVQDQLKKIAEILCLEYDNLELEIVNFFKDLEIELNFKKLGINRDGFIKALEGLNHDRLKNNPRLLLEKDLENIYNFNINL